MKKITMLFILFFYLGLFGQNIVQVEYFIDTAPGYGNGTQVNITTPDSTMELSFNVGLAEVSDGFHILYVQAKDDSGQWSPAYAKPFFKSITSSQARLNIVKMEYFIDNDPGYGNGVDVSVLADSSITEFFTVDLAGVDDGFHILYCRSQDDNGNWSLTYTKPFLKEGTGSLETSPDIVSIEWFIDNDSLDTQVFAHTDFPPSDSVDTGFRVDLSNLQDDMTYNLHAYAIDANGGRSLEFVHEFDKRFNIAPAVFNLLSPAVGDTVDAFPITFMWQQSLDVDTGNVVQYIFNISGGDLDTTISGINDTALVFGGGDILKAETFYKWQINATDGTDTTSSPMQGEFLTSEFPVVGVDEVELIPDKFSLAQNYPNPFNPSTTIRYDLPKESRVSLIIYDILGREVIHLVDLNKPAGYHQVVWNGKNRQGGGVPSGIYIYRIVADAAEGNDRFMMVKKSVMLK